MPLKKLMCLDELARAESINAERERVKCGAWPCNQEWGLPEAKGSQCGRQKGGWAVSWWGTLREVEIETWPLGLSESGSLVMVTMVSGSGMLERIKHGCSGLKRE